MATPRLASAVALCLLAGCPHRVPYGGDLDGDAGPDPGPPPDAAIVTVIDASPRPDARPGDVPDARPGGGGPGGIAQFDPCTTDADCMAGYDCRAIPWIGGEKECIPRCDSSADCPFHTFCYPTGGGSLGPSFALMGDHCWFSLCGEAFGPAGMPNSVTSGACQLGEEAGVPPSDQLPGYCLSIDDQYFGQCIEVGGVPPGGSCAFTGATRATPNCNAAGICVSESGSATGTCAQLCQPHQILAGGPTGCTMAGQDCLDASTLYVYSDGSVARGSLGYCTEGTACGLIGDVCPVTSDGQAQGCVPTNAIRPTGWCDPSGATTTETYCQLSWSCMGTADCSPAMTCAGSVCTLPYGTGPDNACPPGSMCGQVFWDAGFDGVTNTADDVLTRDWGTCQP